MTNTQKVEGVGMQNESKYWFVVVTGPRFNIACVGCGKTQYAGDGGDLTYADLNGQPFKAYYCPLCRQQAEADEGR